MIIGLYRAQKKPQNKPKKNILMNKFVGSNFFRTSKAKSILSAYSFALMGLCSHVEAAPLDFGTVSLQASGQIKHLTHDKCLDMGEVVDRNLVYMKPCDNSDSQRINFTSAGEIIGVKNKLCLQQVENSDSKNSRLIAATCDNGLNQRWRVILNNGRNLIQNIEKPKYCLDMPKKGSSEVKLWSCETNNSNQYWRLNKKAAMPVIYSAGHIKSDVGNQCLDSGWKTANNTNVKTWRCAGPETKQQNWIYTAAGEIRSGKDYTKCLDVQDGQTARGTNVQLYVCNGSVGQQWRYNDRNQFRSAVAPSRCLNVDNNLNQNNTNVKIGWCAQGNNKTSSWSIYKAPWAKVKSLRDTRYCLTSKGGTARSGDNIGFELCTSKSKQYWLLNAEGQLRNAQADNMCATKDANSNNIIQQECNKSVANRQLWKLTRNQKLQLKAFELCFDMHYRKKNAYLHTCHEGVNQKYQSLGFMQLELAQTPEGHLALVINRGDQQLSILNPVGIMSTLYSMGASVDELSAIYPGSFSEYQVATLSEDFKVATIAAGIHTAETSIYTTAGVVTLAGPNGGGRVVYDSEQYSLEMELVANLIEANFEPLKHVNVGAEGPSAIALVGAGRGHLGINTSVSLIGAGVGAGNEDNSHVGVGFNVGLGIEGLTSFGRNDQYGATLGIKMITVDVYVTGKDVSKAYNKTATAFQDAIPALEGAANTFIKLNYKYNPLILYAKHAPTATKFIEETAEQAAQATFSGLKTAAKSIEQFFKSIF